MCAPNVIRSVREEMSRRGFLTTLGGAVAAAAVSAPAAGVAQQKPVRLPKGFRDVHDLTHTFSPKTPVFPAFKPIQIRPKFSSAKDGFFANEITFDEHTGTHMDARPRPSRALKRLTSCRRKFLRSPSSPDRSTRREERRRAPRWTTCSSGRSAMDGCRPGRLSPCTRAGARGCPTRNGFSTRTARGRCMRRGSARTSRSTW